MTAPLNRLNSQDGHAPDDEIELEPTRMAESDVPTSEDFHASDASQTGPATSFASDTARLLRSRLLAVTAIVGFFFAVRYILAAALGSCRCSADWDDSRAELWWLDQAGKQVSAEIAVGAAHRSD
jgi:hypothetical protein